MKFALSVLGSVLICSAVSAHHSFADYDRTVIREMEGDLLRVGWRNPHVTFTVRVAEPGGAATDWELETAAVYLLVRAGLDEALFPIGEKVRVAGWASETRPGQMQTTNMLLPDGEEVVFNAGSGKRWEGEAVAGGWTDEIVDRRDRGLFRVWSLADMRSYGRANRAMAAAVGRRDADGAPSRPRS